MNIFALSVNPEEAARWHVDRHVVKMPIEAAQVLSAAHHVLDPSTVAGNPAICRKAYAQHSCSVWARSNETRYLWLASLGMWLCAEYTHRYGRVHATQARLEWLVLNPPPSIPPGGDLLPFTLAMPDQYRQADSVAAYRSMYIGSKAHLHRWTGRNPPPWINQA